VGEGILHFPCFVIIFFSWILSLLFGDPPGWVNELAFATDLKTEEAMTEQIDFNEMNFVLQHSTKKNKTLWALSVFPIFLSATQFPSVTMSPQPQASTIEPLPISNRVWLLDFLMGPATLGPVRDKQL
jgi:hypothetical protein